MTSLCNLDGEIVLEGDARIPVLDRGFLFGDSIYEVLRTRSGVPFAWREHLGRLQGSAAGLLLRLDLDEAEIVRRIDATLKAARNDDSYVRIIVSRGTGSAPSIDLAAAPGPLRWVVLVRPLVQLGGDVRLALIERLRNDRRALDPACKTGNYLNNVLGLAEAKATGATDCVFLNAAGHVTEASTSNVFVVRDGELATPPLADGILAGVTRSLVLELCRARGDRVVEAHLTAADLRQADEIFLTATLRDISPVSHLDGIAVRNGRERPLTSALARDFRVFADRRAETVDGPLWRELLLEH